MSVVLLNYYHYSLVSFAILSCLVMSSLIRSCLVFSCLVLSCFVLSFLLSSRLFSSRLVLSYFVRLPWVSIKFVLRSFQRETQGRTPAMDNQVVSAYLLVTNRPVACYCCRCCSCCFCLRFSLLLHITFTIETIFVSGSIWRFFV